MRRLIMLCAVAVVIATSGIAQTVEGFGKGLVDVDYPHTGTQLLDSFFFQFVEGTNLGSHVDHHLTQLLFLPDFPQGKMRLGFHDKNSDDRYFYKLSHVGIGDPRVRRFTRSLDICDRSRCTVTIERPAGDFVFVLVGLQLAYRGTDHHVDEIGVIESNGALTVFFNDKNDDDVFQWSIKYAYVPADLFIYRDVTSGTRERRGARRTIPAGNSVIRGFKFNFEPHFTSGGDHHIRSVGVLTQDDGRLEVWYNDKNEDDGFDWEVHSGVLR